jgi:AcrR family transcriptional regulator
MRGGACQPARRIRSRSTMAAPTRTPRDAWIEEGLRALAAAGPDAVRVDALARALGVTRGGFYWHFKDRGALMDAILDQWEQVSVDQVIARVDADGGDPRERLRGLFDLARARPDVLAVDLAVRDWARRDAAVGRRLRRVDNRRMAYLRELFAGFLDDPDEVEARSLTVASLWIGQHFFAAEHPGTSRGRVVGHVLDGLLGA